ncbi:hypothetical protein CC78DRAFT_59685 [Lojkania enalia]|uniref:Copper-fist domain-containing protein n=1 Tax=Lojkania enalia TaxID=147567 RepID=A0A9P4KF75_9PLEO|nr:hypothetical protein CC78DRAFT_59685 [Didymosphaeria enalia]
MPVIGGEKYACMSCIKGHRVSGCTHTERELHHINPKGRPVKQCDHCRIHRKDRSHHVKCGCGEKKDKHKDKGDAKGEIFAGISVDEVSNHAAVDDNRCCCHSGAKCICGLKKDNVDLKLDTSKHSLHDARAKPKLTSTHSESTLTVFANGHHKPCHRNNNSAHVSGAPYKIPRPHSLHGSAAFAAYSQSGIYGLPDVPAQRSMDTLSMSNTDYYTMLGSGQRSVDGLPITPLTGSADSSGVQESLFNTQPTSFPQDGASPSESQGSDTISTTQWPWASTFTPVSRNFGFSSLSTSPSQDCLPNLADDWAIPSAGLSNPLWSAGDLPLNPNKLSDTLTQPISHSGDSRHSAPGLTTASSAQSEMGEPALFGDMDLRNPQPNGSDSLFWDDKPTYHSTASAPSEARSIPTSIPVTTSSDAQGLEFDLTDRTIEGSPFKTSIGFTPNTLAFSSNSLEDSPVAEDIGTMSISIPSSVEISEPSAIAMPNNVDDVVSNDPWLLEQNSFGGLGGFDVSYSNWP